MEKRFVKVYYIVLASIFLASKDNYVKILGCIIRYVNYHNELCMYPKEIAAFVGCSPATAERVINEYTKCDMIRKIVPGRYMVNPSCMMRGGFERYYSLMEHFNSL